MKNANMIVAGQPAGEIDLLAFTSARDMVEWEYASYDAYGEELCRQQGIETLADLYGEDFDSQFRLRHKVLLAQEILEELLIEHTKLTERIEGIRNWLANPDLSNW